MRTLLLSLCCLILTGYSSSAPGRLQTRRPVLVDRSAKPILKGSITDEKGNPIPDVEITLYGGSTTRWKVASTKTDAKGQYTFDPCRYGTMTLNEKEKRWDYFVGMTLSHPKFASADGKSWWDIRVPQVDRHVTYKDFSMITGGTLTGVVVDQHGHAVANLHLRIKTPQDKWKETPYIRYTTTDTSGHFNEPGLYPRKYEIELNSPKLRYPVIGKAEVQVNRTRTVRLTFSAKNKE